MKRNVLILMSLICTVPSVHAEVKTIIFEEYKGKNIFPSTAKSENIDWLGENQEIITKFQSVALVNSGKNYYLQFYPSSVPPCFIEFEMEEDYCSEIILTTDSQQRFIPRVQLLINGNEYGEQIALNAAGQDYTFTIPSAYQEKGNNYRFEVNSDYLLLYKVSFTVGEPKELKPANLRFTTSEARTFVGNTTNNIPTLNYDTTAEIIYLSSNPAVATVDSHSGQVLPLSSGTTVITAHADENAEYYAGEASYILSVTNESVALTDMKINGATYHIGFDFIVAYQYAEYTYLKERNALDMILMKDASFPRYNSGDVILGGWYAEYSNNDNWAQLKAVVAPASSSANEEITPEIVSEVTDADINKVILIEHIDMAEMRDGFSTGWIDDKEYQIRNLFNLPDAKAGSYKMLCAVGKTEDKIALYPIELDKLDLIINIKEESDSTQTLYYDLLGRKTHKDAQGILIKHDKDKVSKIINK